MTTPLEKTVETHLKKRIKALGWLSYKFTSPATRGVPDQLVFVPRAEGFADVWFCEIKREGGEATKLQLHIQAQMRAHGARVIVLAGKAAVDAWISEVSA